MIDFELPAFAAFVARELTANVDEAKKLALRVGAAIIQKEAKRVIGTYDASWPQLAESTQEKREHEGFPANEPLLRTGDMRASIGITIVTPGEEAWIGSNDPIAVYQELGTPTIPPRPFLSSAVTKKKKDVAHAARDIVATAAHNRSHTGHLVEFVFRELEKIGHKLHEDFKELVEAGEHPEHNSGSGHR
jgi:hypothetical protein